MRWNRTIVCSFLLIRIKSKKQSKSQKIWNVGVKDLKWASQSKFSENSLRDQWHGETGGTTRLDQNVKEDETGKGKTRKERQRCGERTETCGARTVATTFSLLHPHWTAGFKGLWGFIHPYFKPPLTVIASFILKIQFDVPYLLTWPQSPASLKLKLEG